MPYPTNTPYNIYDDNTIGPSDEKFTLKYIVITNIVSFCIGYGVHYLLII